MIFSIGFKSSVNEVTVFFFISTSTHELFFLLILLVLTFVMIGEPGFFSPLMPKEEDFSRALYTFDIGQNDLTYLRLLQKHVHLLIQKKIQEHLLVVPDRYEKII